MAKVAALNSGIATFWRLDGTLAGIWPSQDIEADWDSRLPRLAGIVDRGKGGRAQLRNRYAMLM
jgi:hypothetical protein